MTNRRWVKIALLCVASYGLDAEPVELRRGAERIDVIIGEALFTSYYYSSNTAKPYLMPLQSPSGVIISRRIPVVNDVSGADTRDPSFEPHQRPLYFAHGNVNGLDYWSEEVFDHYLSDHGRQAYGRMALNSLEQVEAQKDRAAVRARFRLLDPSAREIAEQTQAYIFQGDERTRTIDCEMSFHATAGPVVLGDTKEGTFAIRLTEELSTPHDHMLNSRCARGEPAIWGKPADWVNYSGTVGGKRVGIAVFDSPRNFRHPTLWMARGYGLLAANPFGFRAFTGDRNQDGSWTISEGQSLRFRYRVVIYDGEFTHAQLAEMYGRYASAE